MIISINGKIAAINRESEFEFIRENQQFEGSEGYSLDIEFPTSGCRENLEIFGFISRSDVRKNKVKLPAYISAGSIFISGSIIVNEVTESSVKCQFIEGVDDMHEEDELEETMINELDLGAPSSSWISPKSTTPKQGQRGTEAVCLPWIADGYTVVNNLPKDENTWHEDVKYLSWMPYLFMITRRIAEAVGYSIDLGSAENSDFKNAVICNTLPGIWEMPEYAKALPAWSVADFFKELGNVMKGSFIFDRSLKSISFRYWKEMISDKCFEVEELLEEYSSEIETEENYDSEWLPEKKFRYKSSDILVWKYLDAPWTRSWSFSEFQTYEEFNKSSYTYTESGHRLGKSKAKVHILEDDTFYVYRNIITGSRNETAYIYPYWKFGMMQTLDFYGPDYYKKNESDYTDLQIVPATVDYAIEGKVIFMQMSGYTEEDGKISTGVDNPDYVPDNALKVKEGGYVTDGMTISQTREMSAIESHKEESESSYYDRIYIGIYDSKILDRGLLPQWSAAQERPRSDGIFRFSDCLRLRSHEGGTGETEGIDTSVKYSFSFFSKKIPDIESIFCIHGQRYLCRSLTMTFTADSISPVIKGEFYRFRD